MVTFTVDQLQRLMDKKMLAQHEQWSRDAVMMGGPDNKIVVGHPEAKKLIFDTLYDAMGPIPVAEALNWIAELQAGSLHSVDHDLVDQLLPDWDERIPKTVDNVRVEFNRSLRGGEAPKKRTSDPSKTKKPRVANTGAAVARGGESVSQQSDV